uniref:Putative cytochrome P450 CYP13A8 n=1 Tax=Aceria tosichella TaxID=561515 RepID=A0A6G1S5F9_9ACAR
MLLQLLILLTSGLLLAIVGLVISKAILDRMAIIRFKKLSRGLPIGPDYNLLGNHIRTMIVSENNSKTLQQWHQELGNTLGILKGSNFVASTIDLDVIKVFVQDEPDNHLDRMPVGLPLEEFEHSIMLAPKNEWRQLRRAIAPALASNKFKAPNVVQEIEESVSRLITYIERRLDSTPTTIDTAISRRSSSSDQSPNQFVADDFVHKYSLDLVFRCLYKQSDLIDFDSPHDLWTTTLDESLNQAHYNPFVKLSMVFPAFRRFVDWLHWNFTEHGVYRKKMIGFIKSQTKLGLEARKQLAELSEEAQRRGVKFDSNDFVLKDGTRFRRNMIDYIIDQFLDGKISKTQYFNNSCFLLGAADKTATDCLVHTIYLLSVNQAIQDKLRNSIEAHGLDSEYLDWVLKESLRVLPPAPIGCSRTITRDIEIEGGRHVIPAGTCVITNAYVIHRLKKYWGEDADEFKPERWSDTSHHHPFQYIPFGAGPRGCPGKQFAMFTMKMFLTSLLKRYKLEGKPRDDVYQFHTPMFIFVIPNSPTKVIITRL